MYKFLLLVLLIVFQMRLLALQLDEERAMLLLFELKHAVNRASHAAAQQLDPAMLAEGIRRIDEKRAEDVFLAYLQTNLRLNEDNRPLPGSMLKQPVEIAVFDVINGEVPFPYLYRDETFRLEVLLNGPGVVAIVRAEYPRIYNLASPVIWTVKGTAELLPLAPGA